MSNHMATRQTRFATAQWDESRQEMSARTYKGFLDSNTYKFPLREAKTVADLHTHSRESWERQACIYTRKVTFHFFDLPAIKASAEQFSPFSFWHAPPEKNSPTILAPCSIQMGTDITVCTSVICT